MTVRGDYVATHKTEPFAFLDEYEVKVMNHIKDLRQAAARILANSNELEESLKRRRGMR